MKYRYIIALAASVTGTAFGSLSAPMPEFKNSKQLAEWRAEKAVEPAATITTEAPAFYTGKPYVAASGGYTFKYRSYDPKLARWMSEDPSGFPDGANGNIYTRSPSYTLDATGLSNVVVTGTPNSGSSGANFSITTVSAPQAIGGAGVAQGESVISFSVNNSMSGWIVQQVIFDYSGVTSINGTQQYASSPEAPYWEAWRVRSISTGQGNISVIGNGNIDTFRTDAFSTALTKGTATINGKIDFYQDSVFNSSNSPLNWSTSVVTRALGQHATYSVPSWWTGTGFDHQLTMSWE